MIKVSEESKPKQKSFLGKLIAGAFQSVVMILSVVVAGAVTGLMVPFMGVFQGIDTFRKLVPAAEENNILSVVGLGAIFTLPFCKTIAFATPLML